MTRPNMKCRHICSSSTTKVFWKTLLEGGGVPLSSIWCLSSETLLWLWQWKAMTLVKKITVLGVEKSLMCSTVQFRFSGLRGARLVESQILVTAKAVPAMGTELIQGSIAAWKQSERSLCCQLLGETQSRWTIKVLQYRCLAVWRTTTKHFKIYQEFYVIIWKDLKRVKKNWAVGALFSENDTQAIIHSKMVIRTQQVGNLIRAGEPPQL